MALEKSRAADAVARGAVARGTVVREVAVAMAAPEARETVDPQHTCTRAGGWLEACRCPGLLLRASRGWSRRWHTENRCTLPVKRRIE